MGALDRVASVEGWLRPDDADKLDELARATPGPILEIGTYHGKSAILMALALRDVQRDTLVYTLEVDRRLAQSAASEARRQGIADRIVFVRGTLAAFKRAYPHVQPTLTFIDGDHSSAGVARDLAVLESMIPLGGLLVFHDFADPRNDDPSCSEVKVRPAVQASWVASQCEFLGTFGVCGLFIRQQAPPVTEAALADISPLESIADQWRYRARPAAGRLWRRMRP